MDASVVQELFAELQQISEQAIADALCELPERFPTALAESVISGYRSRLRQLEAVTA